MRSIVFLLCIIWMSFGAQAHEVRPAYLELVETEAEVFDVNWKQPVADGRRLALEPELPAVCISRSEPEARLAQGAIVSSWSVACPLSEGVIGIAGLERTLTDVFIEVRYLNGELKRAVVRPGEAGLELSTAHSGTDAVEYVRLGVDHILSGPDHLLFVVGLLLLARLKKLILVITAFTLAHSLTLGLTSLGWISLASGPVEMMIAVSILLLAVEAVRALHGQPSFTAERPWLVSFGFGLLHGFGFAGALGEIGLPAGAELAALFYFNVGVEIGQLVFIGVLFTLSFILGRVLKVSMQTMRLVAAYGVGISGAFWVFERIGSVFAA